MSQAVKGVSHRVVALISGGKDSCYSMLQAVGAGHEIVGLANLRPQSKQENELDSYMYQTVGHQAIDLYAEAMRLPLFTGILNRGGSLNTNATYIETENDEVEDLYSLLSRIQKEKGNNFFTAICSGAILSDYQRVRVEHVCSRLGLVSLAYLWRRNQAELLDEMIVEGQLNSIIVKVATLGLDESHLGRSLKDIRDHLHVMNKKYGINICGEGGEYETFTIDCPLFYKSIVFGEWDILVHSADAFAPVALLSFKALHLQDKTGITSQNFDSQDEMLKFQNVKIKNPMEYCTGEFKALPEPEPKKQSNKEPLVPLSSVLSAANCDIEENINSMVGAFKYFKDKHGWFTISNLTSNHPSPTEATRNIFCALKSILSSINASMHNDLVSVTILVSDMSKYTEINKEYIQHFSLNPPVRVCVQCSIDVPLTVSVVGFKFDVAEVDNGDCHIPADTIRQVMHVQSVSHWAAANIGPYSQAVEVNGILHVAGLIGLVAGSMELVSGKYVLYDVFLHNCISIYLSNSPLLFVFPFLF